MTLPMMPTTERTRIIHEFNHADSIIHHKQCIHQLFEQQCQLAPQAAALYTENGILTYDQLNRHANQLAHWLIQQGIQPEQRVAIALPRGEQMMVAILATLKAGAAYVPPRPGLSGRTITLYDRRQHTQSADHYTPKRFSVRLNVGCQHLSEHHD
ncbi:AMP-binding protein [Vibrio sp. PP-XX7]